ncbi:hypothetical protein BOX37_13135 [Nocardia mangyaensis]|uniref:Alanine dehydrogenase/pyridine nucleotide transhydrogenase N-terminal domain-containing protein n=1 Tax=Nocardia mangyaensis TaxID=2213200 RepID=A0A1J0VS00_9NOCA|nr:hypothetical protein [Nocardia mangyaensis]APE34735.1 hypothetical protein BOX37_13135 [Nocardia mangyaensis]
MIVGVLREARPRETRVAATPATATRLVRLGYDVVVETGTGTLASFSDGAYVEARATIGNARAAYVVLGSTLRRPTSSTT